MTTYVLTKASPTSTAFTVASKTTVQFAVTGGSVISKNEIVKLQVDVGSSVFEDIEVSLLTDKLINVELCAGIFRLNTTNTEPETSIQVWVSPTS